MKVVFIAPFGLGQKTTVWARTLPLAQSLVKQGHNASILIPPWDTPTDSNRSWSVDGVEIVNVALAGGLAATVLRLLRACAQRQPDIVHIVKPRAHAGIVQWLLWQRRHLTSGSAPLLLDIDDWEQAWAPINHYAWPVARFLAWQEEWGIRHAHAITAASRWLEQRARRYAPQTPVLYLPNGIDATLLESPIVANRRVASHRARVLFFTRFVEVAPDWLAEFWHNVYAQFPSAQLVIAGHPLHPDGDQPFKTALAGRLPDAGKEVLWLGRVSQEQIQALYADVQCAIFPAEPTVLQQAKCSVRMATTLLHGVPVVASAVGEQANYGASGGAHLLAADAPAAEFAAAVVALLQQPDAQTAMVARAAQTLAMHYRWESLGEKLSEFYELQLKPRE